MVSKLLIILALALLLTGCCCLGLEHDGIDRGDTDIGPHEHYEGFGGGI
jgi:hypothetical protein